MGCGQSKEVLTNQKPASELLTNQSAVEAVANSVTGRDFQGIKKLIQAQASDYRYLDKAKNTETNTAVKIPCHRDNQQNDG